MVRLASSEIVHDHVPTSAVALTITLTIQGCLATASQCRWQDALEHSDQSLAQWRQGGNQYAQRELSLGPNSDIDAIPGRVLCSEDGAKLYGLEDGAYGGTTLRVSAAYAMLPLIKISKLLTGY